MKKEFLCAVIIGASASVMAQDQNGVTNVTETAGTNSVEQAERRKPNRDHHDHSKRSRTDSTGRLLLMERELNRIGVTEEEKAQITELQKSHKQAMEANAKRISEARKKLSQLLDEGAPMEVLEEAIQEISAAQTEQLRILVTNRIEMERILGKEKHDRFMESARAQFKKHGRRGGPPLPPRPNWPPAPGQPAPSPTPAPLPAPLPAPAPAPSPAPSPAPPAE